MCDARLFGPQIAAFSGQRAVHLGPLTGHDTVEDLAADVLASAPPVFALAGLSMGGIVAMEVARQAPERIDRIALLDTNPRAELDDVRARRLPQIEKVRRGGLKEVMRDELKPNYLANGPLRQDVLNTCMEMALDLGPEVFERQSRALAARPDQQETLRGLSCPALVLMGREDRLCPLDRHELMHDLLQDSVLEIIGNAGHLPTLEQPVAVNAAFQTWLER
nr:alpha/beta fold hydrolase [Roseibium denhamense]